VAGDKRGEQMGEQRPQVLLLGRAHLRDEAPKLATIDLLDFLDPRDAGRREGQALVPAVARILLAADQSSGDQAIRRRGWRRTG
jgi:hypothetical protein